MAMNSCLLRHDVHGIAASPNVNGTQGFASGELHDVLRFIRTVLYVILLDLTCVGVLASNKRHIMAQHVAA